ncbi:MAG: hypothetical protein WBA41_34145 [Rivularia sp. (in: cyanobacteria)]
MSKLSKYSTQEPDDNPYQQIELSIVKERLRQARQSFNLALIITAICSGVTAGGTALLLNATVASGTLTAIGGAASSVYCFKFARDANDRLDKITSDLRKRN